jgi:hypothetical protein
MQNSDVPGMGGAHIPIVRGTRVEQDRARRALASQAVRLAPDDPKAALSTVLAHLGLLPDAVDALEVREEVA